MVSMIDVQRAEDSHQMLSGGKIDLSKCYDRISASLAVQALVDLGLPPAIGEFLKQFYMNNRTWFVVERAVSRQPAERSCSLLKVVRGRL